MLDNLNLPFAFGYKEPRFTLWEIVDTGNGIHRIRKKVYDFPEINSGGLIHKIIDLRDDKELLDRSYDDYSHGFHIEWTLHYNEWIEIKTLNMVKDFTDYKNGVRDNVKYELRFTPNIDSKKFSFDVFNMTTELEIRRHIGREFAVGSYLPIFVFKTKKPLKAMPIYDPNDQIYHIPKFYCIT